MPNQMSNTRENGFETLIVESLKTAAGYEQGVNADYSATEAPMLKVAESTVPYGRNEGV